MLRLNLLGLGRLALSRNLHRLGGPITMHSAILVTRLGTVATRCPLTRHTFAGLLRRW